MAQAIRLDDVTEIDEEGFPIAPCNALRDSRTKIWHVKAKCPYCHKVHSHGGGTDDVINLGHRIEHCSSFDDSRKGYVLKLVDRQVK